MEVFTIEITPLYLYLTIGGLIAILLLYVFFTFVKKIIRNRAVLMIFAGIVGAILLLLILPMTRAATIGVFTSSYNWCGGAYIFLKIWWNNNAEWLMAQTGSVGAWFKANPVITNGIILTVGIVATIEGISISLKYLTTRALRYFQKKVLFAFIKTLVAFGISAWIFSMDFMFIDPNWTQTIKVLASVMIAQGTTGGGTLGLLKDAIINALWRPQN